MTYKPEYSKIVSDVNNVKNYVFEKAEKIVQISLRLRLRSNFKSITKPVWHGPIDWIQEIGPCHSKIWQFAKVSSIKLIRNIKLFIHIYLLKTLKIWNHNCL